MAALYVHVFMHTEVILRGEVVYIYSIINWIQIL